MNKMETALDYSDANGYLGSKESATVNYNTTLIRRGPDRIAIQLYATDIVTLFADGSVKLRTGGYYTATTKERMNLYTPFHRISTVSGEWVVSSCDGGPEHMFEDGMTIDAEGRYSTPAYSAQIANGILHTDFHTEEELGKHIAAAEVTDLKKLWKNARTKLLIAYYAPLTFLPLISSQRMTRHAKEVIYSRFEKGE